jgi:hypothetical protein
MVFGPAIVDLTIRYSGLRRARELKSHLRMIVKLASIEVRIGVINFYHRIDYIITTSSAIANDTIAQGIIDAPAK